jgi:hypothetical protein
MLYVQDLAGPYNVPCHQPIIPTKGLVLLVAESFYFCVFIVKCEMFREVSCFPCTLSVIFVIHHSFGDMAHALYQTILLNIILHASVFYCCTLFFNVFIFVLLFELIQKCIQYIINI